MCSSKYSLSVHSTAHVLRARLWPMALDSSAAARTLRLSGKVKGAATGMHTVDHMPQFTKITQILKLPVYTLQACVWVNCTSRGISDLSMKFWRSLKSLSANFTTGQIVQRVS